MLFWFQLPQQRLRQLEYSVNSIQYDGESDKLYTETDSINPINVYCKTKLLVEKAL